MQFDILAHVYVLQICGWLERLMRLSQAGYVNVKIAAGCSRGLLFDYNASDDVGKNVYLVFQTPHRVPN